MLLQVPDSEAETTRASLQGILSLVDQAKRSAVADADALRRAQSEVTQLRSVKSEMPPSRPQVCLLTDCR